MMQPFRQGSPRWLPPIPEAINRWREKNGRRLSEAKRLMFAEIVAQAGGYEKITKPMRRGPIAEAHGITPAHVSKLQADLEVRGLIKCYKRVVGRGGYTLWFARDPNKVTDGITAYEGDPQLDLPLEEPLPIDGAEETVSSETVSKKTVSLETVSPEAADVIKINQILQAKRAEEDATRNKDDPEKLEQILRRARERSYVPASKNKTPFLEREEDGDQPEIPGRHQNKDPPGSGNGQISAADAGNESTEKRAMRDVCQRITKQLGSKRDHHFVLLSLAMLAVDGPFTQDLLEQTLEGTEGYDQAVHRAKLRLEKIAETEPETLRVRTLIDADGRVQLHRFRYLRKTLESWGIEWDPAWTRT